MNLFQVYLANLAQLETKLITSQKRLKKSRQKAKKYKKANHLQYQTRRVIENRELIAQNETLKNQKNFLIKKAVELSNYKIKAEELQRHLNLAYRNIYEQKEVKLLEQQRELLIRKTVELSDKITDANANYYNTVIDLVKEKSQSRKASLALKKRALELKNDFNNKQSEATSLQSKITRAEHDLGIGLDNLTAELEANNYKQQLEQQKDYEEIKQEQSQLKTELNQKETSIIAKINSELKLDLGKEVNLEQTIEKIKELIINKSPDNSQETNLDSLRQQVAEKDEEIKQLEQEIEKNAGFSGSREHNDKVNLLLAKIQPKGDEVDTKDLKEINQLFGTSEYEKQKRKIRELEIKSAQKDPEKYKELVKARLDKGLSKYELKVDELTPQIKNEVESLKENKMNDAEKIVKISNEIIRKVNLEGASKKINSLINQGNQFLYKVKQSQTKAKVDKTIKDIKKFISENNIFQQKAYQLQKPQVEQLLKDLESYSTQTIVSKNHFPLVPTVVSVLLLIFLISLVIVIIRNVRVSRIRKRGNNL
ncbi:2577_t:CDS:2 [Funneliformis geosporum]|uniref:2577_t:CDS:1 n=1 Tax=Funneliformis geosporum TaxID=1117311 RepID=A0A9W4SZ90_9GLOM|nr:2577_t:CDS:2 [Funneliformis geosporum]